jgi:signal transduction histidine kinase
MSSGVSPVAIDVDEVLAVLSRPDDADLAELVEVVAGICDTEVAAITVRRGEKFHVPITHGIEPLVCDAEDSFCRATMSTDGLFVVEDVRADERFASLGFVDGTLAEARFYASAPLHAPTGEMLGRLCVIDSEPKVLTGLQQRSLESLALAVTALIDLRLLRAARVSHLSPEARQAALTLHSQFSAELSHDMRVPLSAIVASVEMLEDQLADHPDRAVGALLNRTLGAALRLGRMLDQNMSVGTTLADRSTREVDLQRVVGQVTRDSTPMLEASGAVVETDRLPVVDADPDDMYSVLQNLVTNAVKFARPDVPARVHISGRRIPGGWRISVADNGVGIPAHRRVDVFSLFSRVHTDVAGHGIGLATVARIVAAHGGRAGAEGAPGGGAEIWFELPDGATPQPASTPGTGRTRPSPGTAGATRSSRPPA